MTTELDLRGRVEQILKDHRRTCGPYWEPICKCGWGALNDPIRSHAEHQTDTLLLALTDDTEGELREQVIAAMTSVDVDGYRIGSGLPARTADRVVAATADALLPRISEHTVEVWAAYESWRETGRAALRALLTIWRALGDYDDRKHMTFGDDPQRVVDETLTALRRGVSFEADAERVEGVAAAACEDRDEALERAERAEEIVLKLTGGTDEHRH